MDAKGWDTPDIIMERAEAVVPVATRWQFYLPLLLQMGAFAD
jgi:hypothetical protein